MILLLGILLLVRQANMPAYEQAKTLHRSGRVADAVAKYQEAVASSPAHIDSHFGLANALVKLGQPERALAYFQSAAKLAPKAGEAQMALGGTFSREVLRVVCCSSFVLLFLSLLTHVCLLPSSSRICSLQPSCLSSAAPRRQPPP